MQPTLGPAYRDLILEVRHHAPEKLIPTLLLLLQQIFCPLQGAPRGREVQPNFCNTVSENGITEPPSVFVLIGPHCNDWQCSVFVSHRILEIYWLLTWSWELQHWVVPPLHSEGPSVRMSWRFGAAADKRGTASKNPMIHFMFESMMYGRNVMSRTRDCLYEMLNRLGMLEEGTLVWPFYTIYGTQSAAGWYGTTYHTNSTFVKLTTVLSHEPGE